MFCGPALVGVAVAVGVTVGVAVGMVVGVSVGVSVCASTQEGESSSAIQAPTTTNNLRTLYHIDPTIIRPYSATICVDRSSWQVEIFVNYSPLLDDGLATWNAGF